MFSKTDFQAWGKKNVVLFASVMTKINDRQNDELLRTYGFTGFPSMALLDQAGVALHKKFPRDLFSIENTVASVVPHKKIHAKIETGDEYDKNKWFMARLGMGKLTHEDAKMELANLKLGANQARSAEQQLLVMEVGQLLRKMRGRRVQPETKAEVSEEVYKIFKSGKRLPESSGLRAQFDALLVDAARKNNDGSAFLYSYKRVREAAVKQVERLKLNIPKYQKSLDQYRSNEREQRAKRYESAIARAKANIERLEQEIVDLDAQAAKFQRVK